MFDAFNIVICVTRYTTKDDGQYCDGNVKKKYYTRLMSSTHLPGNKLVSTEKPGWVAAIAEGRGSVKAVSTREKDGRRQAKASIPPLQPPSQGRRKSHTLPRPRRCWLPASYLSLCYLYTYSETIAFQGTRYILWGGSFSLVPQG